MTDNIKLLYIDLFCGAGGTSTGVEKATFHGDKCAKVIEWIKENVPMFWEVPCSTNRIIDKFKWDFEL